MIRSEELDGEILVPHARSAAASHPRDCQPKRISSSLTGVTAGLAEQKRCHVTLGETLSVFLSSGYECSRLCPRSCATTYRDCTVQLSRLVLIKPRSLFQLRYFGAIDMSKNTRRSKSKKYLTAPRTGTIRRRSVVQARVRADRAPLEQE